MKREEICVGKGITFRRKEANEILVINIEDCYYDMVEMDGIYYLSKLKRKGYNTNWTQLVKNYCDLEGLDENSEKYMLALISYPYEFMKCIDRYRLKKKIWTKEEFEKHLEIAIIKDSESLI